MAIYPRAIFREVPRFRTSMKPARVNLHTAVSNAASLYSYFAPDGRVCSHFYVAKDGTVEQYVDTKYRAAADLQGNPDTISIESWDGYPYTYTSAATVIAWTDAQVTALAQLIAWIWETHPTIPHRLATTSKADDSSHGIGWHRLGVPATYAQLDAGISQTGGMLWSRSVGKTCPGDKRIAQIPTIAKMAAAAGGIGGGTSPVLPTIPPTTEEDDMPTVEEIWAHGDALQQLKWAREAAGSARDAAKIAGHQVAALSAAVDALATANGADPAAIQQAVESAVRDALARIEISVGE